MRLVTWNCNGAFRRKLDPIDSLGPDVVVIQECEDPAQSTPEYRSWAREYTWIGYGKNKGIGVFPRRNQAIKRLTWPDEGFELFLPVRLDDSFDVIGVWTQQGLGRKFSYIGQFWNYLQRYKMALGPNSIICGDLNSNSIWDRPRRQWNHSDCVRELADIGLHSLYHLATQEQQGSELQPTYFQHRHRTKPFHIDYVFAHGECVPSGWNGITVGKPDEWLAFSDHMPIIVDL